MPLRQTETLNRRELGYLPFEPHATHLFFQLVSRRYQRAAC
jgi:hypothetical protein